MSTAQPLGPHSAFFYGTLMAPQVLSRVCHGSHPSHNLNTFTVQPALLHAHRRHRVKNADYPAILPTFNPTDSVRGTYVTGLTDGDLWRLDIFEGSEYERRKVRCQLISEDGNEHGEEKECQTYIWISPKEELEEREWDFEEFKREKMQFWVGAEREDYAGRPSILEVDEAVANAEKDGTRGRGFNGHISNALKEEQEKSLKAAV
ncbi:Protein AIG2 C [Pseudocercospora fuligena]|uniref:Putative gamma-glutamylcyclotransferase n=1 Tax=Pseudocercospora fuligena TaxID=685502 RepID=A0A8H6RHS2_9PEZI|nr:Protein AIG2 C [Pseudocercospora fuligena]